MHRLASTLIALSFLLVATHAHAQETPELMDINAASAADLMMLKGIGTKTADKILAHREKVKGYKHLSQITEVRGVGEKTYQRIACAFMVPKEGPQRCVTGAGSAGGGPKVNINLADAAALTGLSGIGKKKAEKIVTYRTENGWFTSAEDVQGVKGIGPKTVAGFAGQVEVKVDVNRATVADLLALGLENAAAIVKARDALGGFATADDLLAVPGTDKKQVTRARHILIYGAKAAK